MKERQIVESWYKNAAPWSLAVRERQIESRILATDRSIVDAVVSCGGKTAIDLGCGEGWLTRALVDVGMDVLGVDAIPEFIERARAQSKGKFELVTYAEIAAGKIARKFDLAIANFSLFGDKSVDDLFRSMPLLLNPGGAFIVQTLHPTFAGGELPYTDGWRDGDWAGFSDSFTDPAPWYFRTIASWVKLYTDNGLQIDRLCEPIHPHTGKPAAIVFIGNYELRSNSLHWQSAIHQKPK